MQPADLRALVEQVARGEVDPGDAAERLAVAPVLDLGFARLDTQRELRQGQPEAVLAEGKTAAQVGAIVAGLLAAEGTGPVLVTRADEAARAAVRAAASGAEEDADARLAWVAREVPPVRGTVTMVSAGTSDFPALREAAVTARLSGTAVRVQEDVGVAGLHRLALALDDLRAADCVVVAAGGDAALASVVGGLVAVPVIGLPTSTGYGVATGGTAALHAMLSSCAPGVAVVNIDDGFGAGTIAARVARAAAR
jgi:NCAIR mutase (PurE)-related protein